MARKRNNIPIFDHPMIKPLLFILTICSGYFTFEGAVMIMVAGVADWVSHTGAAIFAIASSTAIYLLWTTIPHAIAKLETSGERLIGICITIVATLMIVCLSSWLNVAGLAGPSAMVMHSTVLVGEFEDALDQRYPAITAVQAFQSDLGQANTLYISRAEAEVKHGAYTGRPGPGSVERVLLSVAERFAEQDKAITKELARMGRVADKARNVLEAMRAAANQAGDPKARMEKLAGEADKLRALLGELEPQGLLASMKRSLQAMPREVGLQSTSSKTAAGIKAQKAALARIESELTETVDQLSDAIDHLSDKALPAIPTVTRLNAIEAVVRYPLQHAPYWAGGIALDMTPTLLLIYAMLIVYVRGRRGLFVDDVSDLTVADLKRAQHGLLSIREGQISKGSVGQVHNELTGTILKKRGKRQ